jgi:hypothetical protein
MENVKVLAKHSIEVESEIELPKFFVMDKYYYYKLVNDTTVLKVTNFYTSYDSVLSLELYPSIRVEHIRYVSWHLKPDNFEEITEQEFDKIYKDTIKLINDL